MVSALFARNVGMARNDRTVSDKTLAIYCSSCDTAVLGTPTAKESTSIVFSTSEADMVEKLFLMMVEVEQRTQQPGTRETDVFACCKIPNDTGKCKCRSPGGSRSITNRYTLPRDPMTCKINGRQSCRDLHE
jgi:hypothetical protein